MASIMAGERPERPNHPGFTEPLWALTQRCWGKDPRSRPKMKEVIKVLKELSVFIIHLHHELFTHIITEVPARLLHPCRHHQESCPQFHPTPALVHLLGQT